MRATTVARILAAACLLVAIAVVSRAGQAPPDPTGAIQQYLAPTPPTWRVEDRFYAYENSTRIGGFYAVDQFTNDTTRSPYRVLVLGDSYTFGWGLMDIDHRWPKLLEDELRTATGDARFEVHALALGGSSTFTHARLLEDLDAGRLAALSSNPEITSLVGRFDALVLGFVANDVIPGTLDGEAPDPDLESDVLRNIRPNPYAEKWQSALRSVASFNTPVKLFVPLDFTQPGVAYAAALRPFVTSLGFTTVPLPTLEHRLSLLDPSDLVVHPADAHPGPAVLDAYAKDVAAEILARVEHSTAHRSAPPPPVSNALPTAVVVSATADGMRLDFPPAAGLTVTCDDMFLCLADGSPFTLDEAATTPRVYPCAPIGAHHAYVGLDPLREHRDTELMVNSGGDWLAYPVLVGEYGVVRTLEPVRIDASQPSRIFSLPGLKGIRLAPALSATCDDPGSFPGVSFTLRFPTSR